MQVRSTFLWFSPHWDLELDEVHDVYDVIDVYDVYVDFSFISVIQTKGKKILEQM